MAGPAAGLITGRKWPGADSENFELLRCDVMLVRWSWPGFVDSRRRHHPHPGRRPGIKIPDV